MQHSLLWVVLIFSLFITPVKAQTITHGPVIGGVTDNSARIYIRTDIATGYMLEYSQDSSFGTFSQLNSSTSAALDKSNIALLEQLTTSTTYFFRYRINGALQPETGRFKTFPLPGTAEHLVFVTGSCQETPNMKVFDVMPLHQPDLFIHTGDFTYPSYQIPSILGYPQEWSAVELAWRRRNEEPVCKDMLKRIPMAYMPDDDDTWGNSRYFKGGGAQIRTENGRLVNYFELIPRTAEMRSNCLQGYKDFFPGYPMVNDTDGYYHAFKVGNCEFFMLDVRSCNTGGWNNLKYNALLNLWTYDGNNPRNSLLNQPQLDWFLNALKNSTATWKFIVSGVPFNRNIQRLVELPLLLQGTEFNIGGYGGTGFRLSYSFSDYFGAYAYEREKILNYIKNNAIKNVIVISGDTHGCAIDDGRNAGLPEMNASGLSVTSTELYYQFDRVLSAIGFDLNKWLWNKGGMGIGNDNMKNAFGKMEVFGNDSVQLCIVDEDNVTVACHTVKNNQVITALSEYKAVNDLLVLFPNPVSDKLTLTLNKGYGSSIIKQMRIVNTAGKEIFSATDVVLPLELNTTSFPAGIYFVSSDAGDIFAVQKFVKQ
jgi:alkaline phosphatase D